MKPLKPKPELESSIQKRVMNSLTLSGWYCLSTHGNRLQSGFPDVFACHKRYGIRWVEIKRPKGYRFTDSQYTVFTKFASKNVGVWVLMDETQHEKNKLFGPCNWYHYATGGTISKPIERITKHGPEGVIQNAIIDRLMTTCSCVDPPNCQTHTDNNWFCLETFGSAFQSGFPDIFACHKRYGTRWIECKNPKGYKFTPAQLDVFPHFSSQGVGIWILTDVNEVLKIFQPANWYTYLR